MPTPFQKSGYAPPMGGQIDKRNFILEKAQTPTSFPDVYKTDISAIPVFMQSKKSDCVENAITFVKKYHEYKNTGKVPDLSRRFLAAQTVAMDNFPLSDGTSIQNALYLSHKKGICESQYLPDNHELDDATFVDLKQIPATAYTNALTHTTSSYAFLSDRSIDGLKNAIYQNGFVVVGALINKNWWTAADGTTSWEALDILPIRPPGTHDPDIDPTLSGHAFVLYGYDVMNFYFVNSFGPTWAEHGYGYFKVNEVPFIYEGATIIDLTDDQIQKLKTVQQAAQDAADIIHTLPPDTPSDSPIVVLLTKAISYLSSIISSLYKSK